MKKRCNFPLASLEVEEANGETVKVTLGLCHDVHGPWQPETRLHLKTMGENTNRRLVEEGRWKHVSEMEAGECLQEVNWD